MIRIAIQDLSLEIRPVTRDELDAVLDVYHQCEDFLALGPVPTASMEMVRKDMEISEGYGGLFCGIYKANGEMVGIVDYVPSNFEGDPRAAFLSLLMIAAPFRKLGIGKAVVEAIEAEVKKDPMVSTILSGVQVNNPQAIRFWQRNGFRIISGPELMPDQTTVFGLRKDFEQQAQQSE
jgi:ribosomal protein S18 acetylase RimI-like enzyme